MPGQTLARLLKCQPLRTRWSACVSGRPLLNPTNFNPSEPSTLRYLVGSSEDVPQSWGPHTGEHELEDHLAADGVREFDPDRGIQSQNHDTHDLLTAPYEEYIRAPCNVLNLWRFRKVAYMLRHSSPVMGGVAGIASNPCSLFCFRLPRRFFG